MEKIVTKRRRLLKWLVRIAIASACMVLLSAGTLAALWWAYPFPLQKLDDWPASPRITDRDGRVLIERVGPDGQWRFPVALDDISPHVINATLAAEDKRFYSHIGIDATAAIRAAALDIRHLRKVSGASTLTMQVCRMMDDRPRTLTAKAVESFRALQLESLRSKREILELYLNIAPYGRNIRGIEAASLIYFGKHARDLSLAEAATLAGIPQSPQRLRPDLSVQRPAARAAFVLARMRQLGFISAQQEQQAIAQGAAVKMSSHPIRAPHAAFAALAQRPAGGRTTIDLSIQCELERLCAAHAGAVPAGGDIAAVILDVPTGEILAMVGSLDSSRALDGQVNGVTALRSPGSALKPFIYAAAFEARRLAPDSLVYDVPLHLGAWSPENFDKTFSGPLPAGDALRRSLNIPAILVAQGVGLARCAGVLESAGVRLPADAQTRGGLAIVTGAVEVRLLDLTAAYATIGRGGRYVPARLLLEETYHREHREHRERRYKEDILDEDAQLQTNPPGIPASVPSVFSVVNPSSPAIDPDVCLALDDILSSRRRRPHGMEDLPAEDVPWFMWKTGTSSGRRDAVAVGHNGRYAVGVWVGRFDGRGEGALVGGEMAEPLLAGIFASKQLRTDTAPPPAEGWTVRFPLPAPDEGGTALKIVYPHDGAVFLALDGQAVVAPQFTSAKAEPALTWFLNGVRIEPDQAARLTLARGRYDLRCADAAGASAHATFIVK